MRSCLHCGREGLVEELDFYKGKLYPSSRCKQCEARRARENAAARYNDPVKGQIIREKRKIRTSDATVRDRVREQDRARHVRDHSKRREAQSRYFQDHKPEVYARVAKGFHQNPERRLRKSVSNSIRMALKEQMSDKQGRSITKFLPYSMEQLRLHLEAHFEPWMNWDNWGPWDPSEKRWHIDHLVPQSKLPFDDLDHDNFRKCWSLENLRPMEAVANMRKGSRT